MLENSNFSILKENKKTAINCCFFESERVEGIEPSSSAWKAGIMSHYTIPAKVVDNKIKNTKVFHLHSYIKINTFFLQELVLAQTVFSVTIQKYRDL